MRSHQTLPKEAPAIPRQEHFSLLDSFDLMHVWRPLVLGYRLESETGVEGSVPRDIHGGGENDVRQTAQVHPFADVAHELRSESATSVFWQDVNLLEIRGGLMNLCARVANRDVVVPATHPDRWGPVAVNG